MGRQFRAMAAGLCLAAIAPGAEAASLIWAFDNKTDANISLEFYSQTRDRVWPGEDQVFILGPADGARIYNLDCDQGEEICYGGWIGGDAETYWGSGYDDQQDCETCCAICGGGAVAPVELSR